MNYFGPFVHDVVPFSRDLALFLGRDVASKGIGDYRVNLRLRALKRGYGRRFRLAGHSFRAGTRGFAGA